MNIAIVNKEKIELEIAEVFLKFYVKKFWSIPESQIHIEIFQRPEEFLQIFDKGWYHLVVLGDGMESVADFIRERGDDVAILFLQLSDNF